jgi:hypothetical protein
MSSQTEETYGISNSTPLTVDPRESIKLAEQELNFLAALCMGESMLFNFPFMFIQIWALLKSKIHLPRDFSKLAIGIPRGFAKTTLMKIWIVYCILFTKARCIVIVSYQEEHAINIIKDVCDFLSHPNILALFGRWDTNLERNQQACKIFTFRMRKIVLGAIGSNGSIRGLNIGNARPDVMIFEDFQKKSESENEELSTKLYKEMVGTFMKACSPFGCQFIFVANMYPTVGSILKKLKNNPDWISFIVGAILSDGTSLWEDLQPIDQLIAEYISDLNAGCPEVFLSEKLNDETAGIKSGIDLTKIPAFPWEEDELPQGRAIVLDPALDNPTSDYNGIGLIGLFDGIPTVERVVLAKFTPYELIKQALLLGFETGTRLICVENVALQSTYLFWANKICNDNGIEGFQFMPLNVGNKSKNGKIRDSLNELMKKEVWIKKQVRPFLVNEIIKWDPKKSKNQDTTLDILTFAKKVYEQHGDMMVMPYEPEIQSLALTTQPRSIEENCYF